MTTAELNIFVRIRAQDARRQLAQLRAELSLLQAQTASAQAASNRPWFVGLTSSALKLRAVGRQLTTFITAPLAIASGMAIKWGMDNEKAMAGVAKVYGDGTQSAGEMNNELKALDGAFEKLSEKYGETKAATTEIAAGWAAAGASGLALAQDVDLTMKTMVIGEMDATEATQALIAIQAQYNFTSGQLSDTVEQLNAVENLAGTTLKGLVQGFSRAAGVARGAGVDTAHLAAMIAALTPAAGSANEAGNALKTIISRLMGPTREASDVMSAMGIQLDNTSWTSLTATQRMELMAKSFENLTAPQKAVVSALIASRWQINKFEVAMREMNSTTGYYAKSLDVLKDKNKVQQIAEKELATVLNTSSHKVSTAGQIIRNSMTDAFLPLIPVFVLFMQWIAKLGRRFADINPELRLTIIISALLLAALGPVLLMVSVLQLAVAKLVPVFIFLGRAVLLTLAPFKFLVLAFVNTLFQAVVMARVMIETTVMWTASVASRILGLGFVQVFWARIMLGLQAITAAGMAFLTAITAAGQSIMVAMWRALPATIYAIQTVYYQTLIVLQFAWARASLAVQRGWAVVMGVVTAAAMKLNTAVMVAWWAIQREAAAAYWAVRAAIETVGQYLMQGIAATSYGIQIALQRGYHLASTALSRAYWLVLITLEQVSNTVRLALSRAYWAVSFALDNAFRLASLALERGYHAARLAVQYVYNSASLLLSRAFWAAYAAIEYAGQILVAIRQKALLAAKTIVWVAYHMGMLAISLLTWRNIQMIVTKGMQGVIKIITLFGRGILAVLSSPWTLAIAAVLAIIFIFRKEISKAFRNIVAYFQNLPSGIAKGLSPIANIFIAIKNFIVKVFNMLPQSVANALIAVVRIVKAAALKVYELFSYFNPFAHHSPSLVENVTEGMAVVGDQFAKAADSAEGNIQRMHSAIESLKGASIGMVNDNTNAKEADQRDKIKVAGAGDALPQYDALRNELKLLEVDLKNANAAVEEQQRVVDNVQAGLDAYDEQLKQMNKTMDTLKKTQDLMSAAVDKAKESYDRFASAQIQGMGAADDAVFSNTMAQKKLQLQINKLKQAQDDSTGSVEDNTDAYARLQGQIETLMGKAAELRSKGAGSDILGPYQDMIKGLQDQQAALGNIDPTSSGAGKTSAAVSDLENKLQTLKDQADNMDLENSLKFDPLTRQIEKFTNKTEELPFDQIMGGLRSSESAINLSTMAYDAATAAVNAQQVSIDNVQASRDALADTYDVENKKLDTLKTSYDSVKDAIDQGTQALDDFTGAADETIQRAEEAARKAKEAEDAKKKAADGGSDPYKSPGLVNFENAATGDFPDVGGSAVIGREGLGGDQSAQIDAFTNDLANQVSSGLGGMDPFAPLKRGWEKVKEWFAGNVAPLGAPIVALFKGLGASVTDAFSGTGKAIGDAVSEEKQGKLGTLVQWFKNIWTTLKEVWKTVSDFGASLAGLFGPQLQELVTNVVRVFKDLYNKVQPQLKELWDNLGPALVAAWQILKPILAIMVGAIIGAISILLRMVNQAILPIAAFISTAISSIIGIIDGLIQVFTGAVNIIVGVIKIVFGFFQGILTGDWSTFGDGISKVFYGIYDVIAGVLNVLREIVTALVSFFKNGFELVGRLVYGFVHGVVDFFVWLWDVLVGHSIIPDTINAIVDWFLQLPDRILSFVGNFIQGVIDFFAALPGRIMDALVNLGVFLLAKFLEAKDQVMNTIPGVWQDIVDFFKSIPKNIALALGDLVVIGANLVFGFWEGIKNKTTWLKDKIIQWVKDTIPGPIKWALDIHSPSGVTTEIGEQTGEGVAVGIENSTPKIGAAVQKVSDQITSITLPAIPMNDVLTAFATSTDDAVTKLGILTDGFSKFRTETTSSQDTVQAVNDTMRDTPAALEGFNASMINAAGQIDTTTEAGSKAYSQIKDVQGAFDAAGAAAYQSALDQGASSVQAVEAARIAAEGIRTSFIDQAVAAGIPMDAAIKLADQYGLLGQDVVTKLTATTTEAQKAIDELIATNNQKTLLIKLMAQPDYDSFMSAMNTTVDTPNGPRKIAVNRGQKDGGIVSGPGGPRTDSILGIDQMTNLPTSWVSNGEFVVNAASTKKYLAILNMINSGTFSALADGGPVEAATVATGPSSNLASALSSVESEVQSATEAVQAIWAGFAAEMLAMYAQYESDMSSAFDASSTSVVTSHTEMFAAIAAAVVAFTSTQNTSFTGLSQSLITIITAMALKIQTDYTAMMDALVLKTTESLTTVDTAFTTLGTSLATTMTDSITPVFDAFTPMLQTLEESFATTVDNVGTIWAGMNDKVAEPARFVINDVYNKGIKEAWNNVNGWLGLDPLPDFTASFREGGPIAGKGNGTSDSILARVSDGEHVITAKEVQGAGGHGAILAQRQAWAAGMPAFAKGGPVDLAAAPWAGGGGEANLKPAAILARRNVHKYWPEISTIGGYRAQDAYPDHPSGLALDIMTGRNPGDEVLSWLHQNMGPLALNYTIWQQRYQPAGGGGNMMADRGSPTQNHMDHIHALFNANGVPGIQPGGVGTAAENVETMRQKVDKVFNDIMDPIGASIPKAAEGVNKVKQAGFDKFHSEVQKFLQTKADTFSMGGSAGSGNVNFNVSAGVEQWRELSLAMLAREGQPGSMINKLLMQMNTESSGNPNAINLTDINAKNGTPSKGLMQVIDPTFQSNRDPGLPNDIWDPAANIAASIRYTLSRYGSLDHWSGVGYDQGGMLQPGSNQTVFNATGGPEPVLTMQQWNAMLALSETANTLTVQDVADGVQQGTEQVYGTVPEDAQSAAIIEGLDTWQQSWSPAVVGAAEATVVAVKETSGAVKKTSTALDNFTEVGGKIKTAVDSVSKIALAIADAVQQQTLTFAAIAPIIDGVADLISQIPDQTRDWAADNPVPGETEAQRKQREANNNMVNTGKGLLQIFKDVAPPVLRAVSKIGSAVETLITQNGPIVAAALAMAPVNPIGAAIMLIPVILQSIFTLVPLIIDAIMEIVPALIKAIMKFLSQFMPDSVFSYDDMSAAEAAITAQQSGGPTAMGQGQRYPVSTTIEGGPVTNAPAVFNIYGDLVMPNVTNESGASTFADQIKMIASNK